MQAQDSKLARSQTMKHEQLHNSKGQVWSRDNVCRRRRRKKKLSFTYRGRKLSRRKKERQEREYLYKLAEYILLREEESALERIQKRNRKEKTR